MRRSLPCTRPSARRYLAAERAAGAPFADAWARALAVVPPRTYERAEWVAALAWARPGFEAAYRRPEGARRTVREDVLLAA